MLLHRKGKEVMAITVNELQKWLDALQPNDEVAVDDGGLTIVVVGREEVYCEIGGVPTDDEDGN
jgi:hypothetical protein